MTHYVYQEYTPQRQQIEKTSIKMKSCKGFFRCFKKFSPVNMKFLGAVFES